MNKNSNKFKRSIIFFVILLLSFFLLNFFVAKKINSLIGSELKEKGIEFKSKSSSNILLGNLSLSEVEIKKDSLFFKSKLIDIQGISYYKLLINNDISINSVIIKKPELSGKIANDTLKGKSEKNTINKKQKGFKIHSLKVLNGTLNIEDINSKKTEAKKINITIKDIVLNDNKNSIIPFLYDDLNIEISDIKRKVSEIQELNVGRIFIDNNLLVIDDLALNPLKDESNYIKYVKEEKELISLKIEKIKSSSFRVLPSDSMSVLTEKLDISNMNFELFLDKTHFSTSYKNKGLYSKVLRELPFHLQIKELGINNSKLIYKELTDKEKAPGVLVFNDLNVSIKNIDNSKKNTTDTEFVLKANFMNSSPLDVKYTFAINNLQDEFRIRGTLKNVTSKNMSSYISPAMNVKMEGFINRMDFDFEGNNHVSNGEFNIDFKNFKVKILNEERELDKILSFLANIFVKDSAKDGMVKVKIEGVERDKTKSFWNFFWKNIEEGLKESLL
ncbi:DUF748 domain-containing protein [Polaribacter sargassicola]|uniref:DUF748 domain-containing protein n=1 Tax=Polaribacter sargassicola TaxID=2836891 RepID=UPI001F28C6BF|nr:DUF748 domain-containing protein [Polaribacter sp. DS7-9]MCG1036329.1 DUF748 domain-containing protein [Polaribacter sp. DS7-9]